MRSRSRRRRKTKSSGLLGLLFVTSILAIACGYAINTLLIKGYLWAPLPEPPSQGGEIVEPPVAPVPTPDPPAPTATTFTLQSFSFFRVQAGALSSEQAATTLIQEFNEQGVSAAYFQEGGFYKVSVGIAVNREEADALGDMLELPIFVASVSWPAGHWNITGANAPYWAAAHEPISVMETSFGRMMSAAELTKQQIGAEQAAIQAAHLALSALTPPSELRQAHGILLEAAAALTKAANELVSYMESGDDRVRVAAGNGLIDFAQQHSLWRNMIQNILR